MRNHCQHNLYICHCTPTSGDPSPIHPPSTAPLISTAATSNFNNVPVYVTQQTSVAVMTSPTLNVTSNNKMNSASTTSLVASDGLSSANTALSAFNSFSNTIPRVVVNTNGRTATVATETTFPADNRGRFSYVGQRSRDSGLQASNMTVAR